MASHKIIAQVQQLKQQMGEYLVSSEDANLAAKYKSVNDSVSQLKALLQASSMDALDGSWKDGKFTRQSLDDLKLQVELLRREEGPNLGRQASLI